MDENLSPEPEVAPADNLCISCQSPDIVHGYPAKLCTDCRTKLINYPIPLWVKLFGAGVLLVMAISMIWLPQNIKAAVALERGIKAEKNHNYVTAQQELEKAKKIVPGSIDVLGHLMIASFNNNDFYAFSEAANDLGSKNIEDTALYNQLSYLMDESKTYMPSDTFQTVLAGYKGQPIPDAAFKAYLKKNPTDTYALLTLALKYSANQMYPAMDSLLSRILVIDEDYVPALSQKTMVKRELNQIDSSLFFCDKLLRMNHQSAFAMASKARTLLKAGKNIEGLQLAQQSYQFNKKEGYSMATLALAYHLNKSYSQRDALLSQVGRDSVLESYMGYVKDIIANKVKFQNQSTN